MKIYFLLLSCVLVVSTNAYSGVFSGAIVKLYSDGKQVAKYEAKSGGKLVGSCYVFKTASKLHEKTVTVCGTFSVEEKK